MAYFEGHLVFHISLSVCLLLFYFSHIGLSFGSLVNCHCPDFLIILSLKIWFITDFNSHSVIYTSLVWKNIVREGRKWLQVGKERESEIKGKDNEMMQALEDTQLN